MGKRIERRAGDLLEQVRSGKICSWREGVALHPYVGWDSLRRALKLLRDRGLIETDAEYTRIRPAQGIEARSGETAPDSAGSTCESPVAEGHAPTLSNSMTDTPNDHR